MSADLWAGAEVQLATTAAYLIEQPDVSLTAVLLNDGPLADRLRRIGIPVTVLDETRLGPVSILMALTRILRHDGISIVHTHRYKDCVLGTLAAKLAGVPHVARTVHGLREPMRGWDHVKFRAYEAFETVAMRFADSVVAVSSEIGDSLAHSRLRPPRVDCIHNGVEIRNVVVRRQPQDIRRELGVDAGAPLLGTVGRLSRVKGHDGFLRAARLVLEKEPHARFLLVGAGPLEGDLRALAVELGVAGACLFVGARTDVHDLIAAMDVFVLPSLHEGIPMAILEAMVLGRPIVATAVGGVPEVIRHRDNGLLVAPGDASALADACLTLSRNRHLAARLGARAAHVVADEFSHEQSGRALMDTYRRVAGKSQTRLGPIALCGGLAQAVLERGARRIGREVERRRIERVRRDPAALSVALASAKTILVVCHGNIIRSPFAGHVLRRAIGDRGGPFVFSAGLEAVPGTSSPPAAIAAAKDRGVDLRQHTATRLDADLVAASDVILVMDLDQLVSLRKRFPEARLKTFLLTSLAPEAPLEVVDPVNGDDLVFLTCYNHIIRAAGPLTRVLAEAASHR